MLLLYRTAVLTGAAWICAGLISVKLYRARGTGRGMRQASVLRILADFLVLLVLFLSPFYPFWFSRSPERYVGFVIRFSELVFCSLLVSLITDRILRRKYYRDICASREMKRKDGLRDAVSVLIVSFGIVLFTGSTVLAYHAGASIPLQVILPTAALLLYRGFFLFLRHLQGRQNKSDFPDLRNVGLRFLQTVIAVFFWIRIVLHIENNDFPDISGIPESAASALCVITLVTCALALIAIIRIICRLTNGKEKA